MNRSGAVAFVLVSLMAIIVATTAQQGMAQFTGSVTIKANGTIDPVDAPIERVGDSYTLTGDVGGISVQRSNIILDGNGHTLPGIVTSIDSLGNNVTAKNAGGVYLKNVENVIVKKLTIKDCQIGIYLEQCSNITVSGNTITGTYVPVPGMQSTAGIFVWGGGAHIISGNHIAENMGGIYLGYNAEHNVIVGNNITGNTLGGMHIWESSNNTIYRNRFINNTIQVRDFAINSSYWKITSHNMWDNGVVGNFWSDYNSTDANNDGVGDIPYLIDENNQDNYPLMEPYTEPEPTPAPQEPEPFPITLAAVTTGTVAAIAVSAGLIVYFKKHRRQTTPHT